MKSGSTYDVAIVGGGPAGTTAGTLLKKYDPSLRVVIFEKEKFPREHIGESQLPPISAVLHEMGVWDKVEAAGFPIKIGATYRWGKTQDLWDFEFMPKKFFRDEPRPAKFEGQRRMTAFQVDRAIYDQILLNHAAECGCEVREETAVTEVSCEDGRITGLTVAGGEKISASWYLDASGNVGLLRRALGIDIKCPTSLKNIAFWDYWENAEWAVEIGVGATRVQVMSLGCGWIWFIPLSATRTSIGFICPAEYYKTCGKTPEELYNWAMAAEPRIAALIAKGRREGQVRSMKDWSFVADKGAGENWMLMGEALGFADPILAGGMTLAHTGARQAAYTILESRKSPGLSTWLKKQYDQYQRDRVMQYIRFADFWYAANGQFEDLREHSAKIAADAGLKMNPRDAFRWLSLGGFLLEDFFLPAVGGLDLLATKEVTKMFCGATEVEWEINKHTHFAMNLAGADKVKVPVYHNGRVIQADAYKRGGVILPLVGMFKMVADVLKDWSDAAAVRTALQNRVMASGASGGMAPIGQIYSTMETMLLDHWIRGTSKPGQPTMNVDPYGGIETNIHTNTDNRELNVSAKSA